MVIPTRVIRGGSWNNRPQNLRPAIRNNRDPDNRNNDLGFRLVSTINNCQRKLSMDYFRVHKDCPDHHPVLSIIGSQRILGLFF
jgi:Sulfatase-modifying factor enzyme 1